ncbi:APC family permease [Streptomyces sp. NPDC058067]|uniref:APC family permease n=1 Tax=Streptomyces sp. NPDC058067 TaxID=3346324 RepID=UPI0036EC09DA
MDKELETGGRHPAAPAPDVSPPALDGSPPGAPAPAAGAKYAQQLSRSLTFKENVLITLSSVTPASSVFILVPSVIQGIGGAATIAFAIAAVAGVFMAFCYAELSSRYPVTGGEYAFAARTLGRPTGFAMFLLALVGGVGILAVVALGTGDYLGVVWGALDGKGVGIAVLLIATVVALFNIRTNAWVTGVFLLVETAALVVLAVLGFVHVDQPVSTLWTAQTLGGSGVLEGASWGLVAAATTTAMFAYNGYGTAVYFSEETRHAGATIGRAILWSLGITVVTEMVPLIAVLLGTPSMRALIGADAPMNYFLLARGNGTINTVVSLGIALAIINAVIAMMLQMGRLLYSSARDGSWPDAIGRPLATVHPRLRTPVPATVVVGVATAVLAWLVPFSTLLLITGANLLVLYAVVALSALAGRLTGRTAGASYQMPLGTVGPVLILAVMGYVAWETATADWAPMAITLAIFATGYLYYYAYLHPRRDERWTLPEPADEETA